MSDFVSHDGSTLVNYFYLADGTKTRALDGSGEGLVYRGPFVYRKGSGSSSLTLESAAFGGGRLAPSGAMLYVTDYLGSVRAVVDGMTGELYKAVDYSAFGGESVVMVPPQGNAPHPLATAILPDGLTLREGYTGQEDQTPDFGTSYIDFGARQYSPAFRRWMTPDPLSEMYYGISPYAFCNNNPVSFVDPDGRFPDIIWDVTSIGMGVHSFVQNVKSGNIRGAVGDGFGIAVDVVAAAVPFLPGGVGAVRAGVKVANIIEDATGVATSSKIISGIDVSTHGATKAFNGRLDTFSETSHKVFRQAKEQNGIPRSQQPDRTVKPNTEAGEAAELRKGNRVQYEFTNSKGEKVTIRQDRSNIIIIMNKIQPYEIKEIYPGHYFMMLDMLDTSDILKIVSFDYKYLWFYDLSTYSVVWNKVDNAFPGFSLSNMWLRNVSLECLIETNNIKDLLSDINCSISLVQLDELPPPYLKMSNTTMSEKTKYELLHKLGYLFNVVIPRPSDYGWIICSDIEYLRKIVKRLKE